MAVEPIVRLTRTSVPEVLRGISLVVHTIVPEKYRFWRVGYAKDPLQLKVSLKEKCSC